MRTILPCRDMSDALCGISTFMTGIDIFLCSFYFRGL